MSDSGTPGRAGAATPAALLSQIADPGIVVVENPGFAPGAQSDLARRYDVMKDEIAAVLRSAPGYAPTPCHDLPRLADAIGCQRLLFKDEGPRFGLGSFKAAGAAFAMVRQIERILGHGIDPQQAFAGGYRKGLDGVVFATATSGNHGRALAWAAQAVGARCLIYAPTECSEGRIAEMERRGAEILRTGVSYNPAMARCREDCRRNGWTLFADTSYADYTEIPTDIMLGYAHIMRELADAVEDWSAITHMVIQGGVGAFAAGLIAGLGLVDPQGRIIVMVVEPRDIAALQASARAAGPTGIEIRRMSLMTGISNAEISVAAWPTIAERVRYFLGLCDEGVGPCIRFLARGGLDGLPIEVGETGTAGLTALISCLAPSKRTAIAADGPVGALVFGCEGVTDRGIYNDILAEQTDEGGMTDARPSRARHPGSTAR